jgi:SAM-dependent methyltransferase
MTKCILNGSEEYRHSKLKGRHGTPSDWIRKFSVLLPDHAEVLDLGCGCGRNTNYLASMGFEVTCCDREPGVEPYLARVPNIHFINTDLENEPWPFGGKQFDAVILTFFLLRGREKDICSVIKPGGFLLYETFMLPYPGYTGNGMRDPRFYLKPLEFVDSFRNDLAICSYQQTQHGDGPCLQQLLARKPVDGKADPVTMPLY